MWEKPIIFSPPMVRSILEGRKTQTRRIINPQPFEDGYYLGDVTLMETIGFRWQARAVNGKPMNGAFREQYIQTPYMPDEMNLWVRENFKITGLDEGFQNPFVVDDFAVPICEVEYFDGFKKQYELSTDNDGVNELEQAIRAQRRKTVPSIHMPRWASRINLKITNVRAERLRDISEDDAKAEGPIQGKDKDGQYDTWRQSFAKLWCSIHGPDSWKQNPWVWAVDFERV